jgi:hypothetical protein
MEANPHALPHLFIGYSMSTMASPDDPIFWLHHCNMDRLWHIWIDCNGYDKIDQKDLGPDQYKGVNPISGTNPSKNPYNGATYLVSTDDTIPYAWDKIDSDSVVFPKNKWPTPRKLWSCGNATNPGHDGIFYRYGTDQLVRAFSRSCIDKASWTLVDVGYVWVKTRGKKRDENLHPLMSERADAFEAKLKEGKPHRQIISEMAQSECAKAPKNDIDHMFMMWINMANHAPEAYDTICDKPSLRLQQETGTNDVRTFETGTAVPLWVILVASLCSGLVVIAIISIIIISVRRKPDNTDGYRQMDFE